MGRGRFSLTFISVLTFGAFLVLLLPFAASGKEFRREVTCYSDTLNLDCGKLSFIAIHEAYFTTAHHENKTCHSPASSEHEYIDDEVVTQATNYSTCYEDIRVTINKRCSGLKNCSYSYNSLPERSCFNPEGHFVVQYDCVRDSSVNKYCNAKIDSSEGYITSPGFPQYYPELSECSWTLSASEGQTILAKILHLHLRDPTEVIPTAADPDAVYAPLLPTGVRDQVRRCEEDRLSAVEGLVKRFSVCGEDIAALRTLEVDASEDLELRFRSVGFLPAAGFLVYFKILGCPSPLPGEGSYLVERNGSAAVFACHNNQVFEDTLEVKRYLQCVRDHHWNDTLSPCITYEEVVTTIMAPNSSLEELVNHVVVDNENTTVIPYLDRNAGLVEDIIVPCILIGILIIGNIIIVIIIFIIRRRQSKSIEEEMEEIEEPKTQPLVAAAEETDDV